MGSTQGNTQVNADILLLQSGTISDDINNLAVLRCFTLTDHNDFNEAVSFVSNAHKCVYTKSDSGSLFGMDGQSIPPSVFYNLRTAPDRIEYNNKAYWLDRVESIDSNKVYYYMNIGSQDDFITVTYANNDYTVQYEASANTYK